MTVKDLAERVDRLEKTLAELSNGSRRTGAWYLAHAGQFENDPVYAEIVRRGQAYRRSLRPKASKSRGS
jgi:hypothetical protein